MNTLFSLEWLIAIPMLVGVICLLLPSRSRTVLHAAALVGAVLTAASGIAQSYPCLLDGRELGGVYLRLDGLSAMVLFAVVVVGVLITAYSTVYMADTERLSEYYGYLLWTLGASCGAVLARDMILLLIFWGFLGLTLFMLIGIAGPAAAGTAKKTFIIIGGSDCVLMLGVALFWTLTGHTRLDAPAVALAGGRAQVAFLCFAVAAFAKAGVMPLHTWVPDCGEHAPIPVTAFLPASVDKLLGIYLLARAAHGLFDLHGNAAMEGLLMAVGAGTIILAVMMALVQHDMKRLLSYHAVSQVGYMVLGIGTGGALGLAGALFHMLNNAIYKSGLFMCAGVVEKRTGTTDLDHLGGLAGAMPKVFAAFVVCALAISGIPPLNGFASKWLVYQAVIDAGEVHPLWPLWLVAAMLGSALTLASFVKLLHAVFLRKPRTEIAAADRDRGEVPMLLWLPPMALAVLCVLFGVLAYALPIAFFIVPATGVVPISGLWMPGVATVLLLLALAAGAGLIAAGAWRGAGWRACPTYIGGEDLAATYISDLPADEPRDVEVTGTGFYESVQSMLPFRRLYEAADRKVFDPYDVGREVLFYFVELLRAAHTGRLPLYITWVLVGMAGLVLLLAGVL